MEVLCSRVIMNGDDLPSRGTGKDSPSNNIFPEAQSSGSVYKRTHANIKKVKFLKNGDKFFGGILFTVSSLKYRTLDALMNELTEVIPLPLGVRSILTPQGGSRIESIDQLEHGKTYICSSKLGLKKMDYSKVKSPTWAPASKVRYLNTGRRQRPTVLRTRQEDGTISMQGTPSIVPLGNSKAKVITVIRNGPPPRQKTKILVNQRSTPSWEHLFQSISDLFQLRSNPVKRLFMMNGVEVQSISQLLQGGDLFIAVGSEPFDISDFATGIRIPKIRRCRRKTRMGSETSSPDESSSSESDDKEDPVPVTRLSPVTTSRARKHLRRSINDLRSPLEQLPTLSPRTLTTQTSAPNCIPQVTDRVPPIPSQAADQQAVNGQQCSDTSSNGTSQVTNHTRRPRGYSLDSDVRSKSTESEEMNVKEAMDTGNSRLKPFASTPTIKLSQFGYPNAIPDTPNSSNLSMSGQNMIEMVLRLPQGYSNYLEKATRTVGVQTGAAGQQVDCETVSSRHTISSAPFTNKPRSFDGVYTKGNIIGEGRFAVVRSSTHRTSGKECALKIINRAKVFGREDIVENELKIMKSVNHPNIIKLIEDFETDNDIILVMELLQGGDLFDAIIHCHHFTEATSKRITRDLGHALLYLHGKKIVHRDIKPENIFIAVNPDGSHSLKLGDFGMATVVTEPLSLVCGTPCYTAPEMLLETGYGLKIDIWACGVICYILLCGFPPFGSQKNTKAMIYENIKKGVYTFFTPFWDTISAEAKDLITQMLQYSPNRRCSAEEMLRHPWLRDTDNMVDHLRGDGTDSLARKFHDHIQSQRRAKNNFIPVLSTTALDRRVHQMHMK